MHLPRSGRVLEVGCGAGRFLRALAGSRPGLARVGADVSRRALEALRSLDPEAETRLLAESGAALPFETGTFQAVLALDVLEHLHEPDAMLGEIARVLAPGGVLHACVPCEGDPRCLWRWLPGQRGPSGLKHRLGGHVQRFRRRELLDAIAAAGLELLRVRNSLHLLGNLADVAAFAVLAREERAGGARTTGDLRAGGGEGTAARRLARAVDAGLWWEARLLSRVPSWNVHVSARRPRNAPSPGAGEPSGAEASRTTPRLC